jgi:cholest-4-en-3-one 26-monooxygenase
MRALEPHIRELAVRIVEKAIAKGTCDFVVDVAAELPTQVIAELIGVPDEDRHKIVSWTNRMVGSEDPEYFVSDDQTASAMMEMFAYVHQLTEQRRTDPRDDIMSALIGAEVDGDKLTELELDAFFLLLSAAGNETTRNSITHGVNAFLENPSEYEKLVGDPEGMVGPATEEILRWSSPVLYFRRNVTRDIALRDEQIKSGDKVSMWFVSANRDEDVFDDPFRFNIERSPNVHVAFGGGGPHFCLGASLARMEIRVMFEELVRRVPVLRALGPAEPLRSNLIGGIKHLPIDLSATPVRSG